MEVILVRHGITEGNKEKRFVGRLDVPLAPEGEAMARETAPLMPPVEHLYVSPMLRCRQTADLLLREHAVLADGEAAQFNGADGNALQACDLQPGRFAHAADLPVFALIDHKLQHSALRFALQNAHRTRLRFILFQFHAAAHLVKHLV